MVLRGVALSQTIFSLWRASSLPNHSLDLEFVQSRDHLQHLTYILQQSLIGGNMDDFSVQGFADLLPLRYICDSGFSSLDLQVC